MSDDHDGTYHHDLHDSNYGLEIPVLPALRLEHLLTTSYQIQRESSFRTMSSVADDSSIADSVSSIGQEEWEKVAPEEEEDEDDSDIEEHETISRVPTPLVDVRPVQQDAVLVFPAPSDDRSEAKQVASYRQNKEGEKTDHVIIDDGNDNADILMHWAGLDDFHITFSEALDNFTSRLKDLQDVDFPLVKITGQTAKAYLSESLWKDLDHLAGAVRLRMANKPLSLSRPLKLFYLGDTRVQGALEAKIGSALIASGDDSEVLRQRRRYSVMPVSWDKDSPEVELMPDSGANIDVETCVGALVNAGVSEPYIEIVLQSGETVRSKIDRRTGKATLSDGYQLPDLAIIHLPENEFELPATRVITRKFLSRHHVPTIVVSSNAAWDAKPSRMPVDVETPHLSLQIPGQSAKDSQIFKRLPIDIDTFLRLNSRQLSRNLACFVHESPRTVGRSGATGGSLWGRFAHGAEKILPRSLEEFITSKGLLSVSFLLMLLSAFYLSFFTMYNGPMLNAASLASNAPTTTGRQTQTVTIDQFTSTTTTLPVTSAVATLASVSKELMTKVSDASHKSEGVESFVAELHGDNVVIVRPPKWFANLRRAPTLSFRIVKAGKSIEHDAKRVDDKVYALSIPREHAHGVVDVQIHCGKLSRANQTIQVDLGSAWAKLLDWIKATSELGSGTKNATLEIPQKTTVWFSSIKDMLNVTRWQQTIESPAFNQALVETYEQMLEKLGNATRQAKEQVFHAVPDKESRKKKVEAAIKDVQASASKVSEGVRRGISQWRATHFRDEQKQLLKLWWKISGEAKPEKNGKEQSKKRGFRAGTKKARKARNA